MFEDSFSEEITDYRKLRTGHKRLWVVVVDQKRWILFVARVLHNRPLTTGRVRFDNGKSFQIRTRTVEKQKVALFLWTEELERRWIWQNLTDKIRAWLENARPEDVIVVSALVGEESGRTMFWNHVLGYVPAKQEIMARLSELGLVQLQGIAGMLYPESEKISQQPQSQPPAVFKSCSGEIAMLHN